MKNKILIFFLAFFLILAVSGCGSKNKQTIPTSTSTPTSSEVLPATSTINIQGFAFDPAVIKVKQGTTVTWTNSDSATHQIKSSPFSSDPLKKGQSFSFTFNNVGNFDYFCSIHPTMKGLIIVE